MFNKKIMILAIFLVLSLAVSAVSAGDNAAENIIGADANDTVILEEIDEDSLSNDDEQLILEENVDGADGEIQESNSNSKSLEDLKALVYDQVGHGGEVNLENNYAYDVAYDNYTSPILTLGISVIDGHGHTIEGGGIHQIFVLNSGEHVTFRNITFKNCFAYEYFHVSDAYNYGGAIYVAENSFAYVENCTFIHNGAQYCGGAISGNFHAVNCIFDSNYAKQVSYAGGAVLGGQVRNCKFINNYAAEYGSGGAMVNSSAINCTFTNNYVGDLGYGAAMVNSTAINCTFIDNHVQAGYGGAAYNCDVTNCTFINNRADCGYGGAMYKGTAKDSRFFFNEAYDGGATYEGKAENCIYLLNRAENSDPDAHSTQTVGCEFATPTLNSTFYKSAAHSQERLFFNLMYDGNLIVEEINTTVSLYQRNQKIEEYNIVNGRGWIVDLNPGDYIVIISADKTNYQSENIALKILTLSTISANNLSEMYGSNEKFKITLANQSNPISGADLTVDLNGTISNYTTDENGLVSIPIKDLLPGEYIVKIHFDGDETFAASNATAKITIRMQYTRFIADNLNTSYGADDYLIVTLEDTSGNLLSGFNVTVDLNGKQNYTTDGAGQIKISTKDLPIGNYTVNISYGGNDLYHGSNATVHINVTKIATQLFAANITTSCGDDNYLIVTLIDGQGNFLSGFNVTVDLNGTGNYTTDDAGQIKIPTKDLLVGNYVASIVFAGSDIYMGSNATANVIVNKVNTKITASKVTVVYGTSKNIVVTLKDAKGIALANKKVTVKLNGKSYSGNTNAKGQLSIAVPKTLAAKTYAAAIAFAGDDTYVKSSGSVKVVVKKATPKIAAKKKTFKAKAKTKKYAVTLKDNNGKAMKNVKLTLKIKGKTFKATTGAKGKATFKIKKLTKKGTFKTVIAYKGTANYNKVTKTVKIKLK